MTRIGAIKASYTVNTVFAIIANDDFIYGKTKITLHSNQALSQMAPNFIGMLNSRFVIQFQ
mgnify:CR=1 FL=1